MSKEQVYDDEVSPLMSQIIAICKRANINMAATFSLGIDENNEDEERTLFCTTVIDCDKSDDEGYQRINQCRRVMNPPGPSFMAFTIIGGQKS